ncbi:MAG: hypothetical protein KAQ93_06180 [Spirochaetales bacterium]|nr:hypothetical protein [Spirochaetales bacterium]
MAKALGFGMDGTKGKIILNCFNTNRSLTFFKRMDINAEYNIDTKEISIAINPDGVQIVFKDN